jgi:hypothetical protein
MMIRRVVVSMGTLGVTQPEFFRELHFKPSQTPKGSFHVENTPSAEPLRQSQCRHCARTPAPITVGLIILTATTQMAHQPAF